MADFRKLAMDLLLADDKIDDAEVKLLKKHLGALEGEGLEFVEQLRSAAKKKGKEVGASLDKLLLTAFGTTLVSGGAPAEGSVASLKKILKAGYAPEELHKFLKKLKKDATSPTDDFTKFVDSEIAKGAPAKA